MISALDQLSYAQGLAAQQAGQQNSGFAGDPAQFAPQFAQLLAASQGQGQNTGQQATPASLTFSANTLSTQVSQASQAADPNAVIAAQIQSNLTAQAASTSATQTPEQAKGQQDSLVLQSLNYQASLAMNQGNIPAFMTFQAMINKQMTSMGLITQQAKAATKAASATQATPTKATAAKTSTRTSAKTAAAVAAAAASASQVAASNASTASSGSSASAQLTDTVLSNASTAGSAAAELASNASTTGSQSAALASNAGAGGATTAQNQSQTGADDPADDLVALQAELDALLADLEGESLDAALDSLASITSKYGSAQAA